MHKDGKHPCSCRNTTTSLEPYSKKLVQLGYGIRTAETQVRNARESGHDIHDTRDGGSCYRSRILFCEEGDNTTPHDQKGRTRQFSSCGM